MADNRFWRAATFAGAAVAGTLFATPALAQDAPGLWRSAGVQLAQAEGRGRWQTREARSDDAPDRRSGGWQAAREAREARREQRTEAPRRDAPDGGWRSQRPAEGTRFGRDRDDDGVAARPAPAWRGAEPQPAEGAASEQRNVSRERQYRVVRWPQRRTETPVVSGRDQAERAADEQRGVATRPQHREVRWPQSRAEAPVTSRRERVERNWDRRDDDIARRNDRDGWRDGSRHAGDNNRNRWRDGERRWNGGWRRDRRYDWYSYRNYNRGLYRLGRYYAPYRSYYYRPLSSGFFLEPLFFGQRYWIADPWQYRLPPAYGTYRWVRYYDDVLLVDIYSGEVVDVVRNFFW